MKKNHYHLSILFVIMAIGCLLMACSDNGSHDGSVSRDNSPNSRTYRITITNITHNQPISPPAIVMHSDGYVAWRIGEAVSGPLEVLAEGGDPADFIDAAQQHQNVLKTATVSGVVAPGAEESVDISVQFSTDVRLSMATMLVNTNDAFTGVDDQSLSDLDVGQTISFLLPAYDAGTESNNEEAGSVPGPAAGGEGFNAARNDSDYVRIHPGIVSNQDGLTGSTLDNSHRWDNPVIKLTIDRTG